MFVKALTLKGFKSFAESTTLELRPGVNVVVGPNGSGKSNIIDAVAWVLGAQGARALRGGKMDDVIFAGTTKRQGLGRAEVSLVIDNADGKVPIEFTEFTITRTLFRTGESEYAINGVACRLLDIQELLSDSGVGRQQHVIVSQGNLDAVLTARPEDRRMIIEEAAGVLKYRKRREKAQRRLAATEQNLERLQDLVREVRSQMRPLQKQANAAMRYDAVVSELRSLKQFVTVRDIDTLQHRVDNAEAEFAEIAQRDTSLRINREHADKIVDAAERELAAVDMTGLSEYVERLDGLVHQAKSQYAVMTERRRTWESELSAEVSKDVVAQLEHDLDTTTGELVDVGTEAAQLEQPFDELQAKDNELAEAWLTFESEWGEGLPMLTNEAAELRGAESSLQRSVDSLQTEIAHRSERVVRLLGNRDALQQEHSQLLESVTLRLAQREALEERLSRFTLQEAETKAVEADALRRRETAQQEIAVATARLEALTSALDESRARAGAQKLAKVKGVVGALADLVEVDDDYQAAFEAAAGEAMSTVVVGSIDAARDGLQKLREGDDAGAVLVLDTSAYVLHGAPEGCHAKTLRNNVRGTKRGVDQLLDRLLCCCVVVDGSISDAVDVATAYPDLIVVTKNGDRFSRNGWQLGSGGVGATQSAVTRADVARVEAETTLAACVAAHEVARAEWQDVADVRSTCETQRAELDRAIETSRAEIERIKARTADIVEQIESAEMQVNELVARLDEENSRVIVIQQRLPELEAAEATGAERARLWREARGVLEVRTTSLRDARRELEVRRDALVEREAYLQQRIAALRERLSQHSRDMSHAAERREALWQKIHVLDALRAQSEAQIGRLDAHAQRVRDARDVLRARRQEVADRLETARRNRSTIERELLGIAERRQGFEVRQAELRMRLDSLHEVLRTELEVDYQIAALAKEPTDLGGKTPKQRIAELERDIRQMGPVNPLAIEEFREIEERHSFLDQQLQDVQGSRRELMRVIRSVDAEIVDVFRSAFDDVSRHFDQLFGTLFPGGAGRLRLTDPEMLLETGIEIDAKPSGKNLRTLSLLSGGERSLVALAFLFAVFRSRPSPFYLLDEVEAALDDFNLSRFLLLVEAFRSEAQLVIVSHQKRTMEAADCLYGVSMQPGGSSKVVSERLHVDLRDSVKPSEKIDLTHSSTE